MSLLDKIGGASDSSPGESVDDLLARIAGEEQEAPPLALTEAGTPVSTPTSMETKSSSENKGNFDQPIEIGSAKIKLSDLVTYADTYEKRGTIARLLAGLKPEELDQLGVSVSHIVGDGGVTEAIDNLLEKIDEARGNLKGPQDSSKTIIKGELGEFFKDENHAQGLSMLEVMANYYKAQLGQDIIDKLNSLRNSADEDQAEVALQAIDASFSASGLVLTEDIKKQILKKVK